MYLHCVVDWWTDWMRQDRRIYGYWKYNIDSVLWYLPLFRWNLRNSWRGYRLKILWFYVFCNTAIAVPNRDIFLLRIKKLFRQQKCVRCGYYCHCKGCNYFLLFRKSFIVKWHTIIKSKNKNTAKQNTADNKQNSVDAVITGVVGCKIYSRKNLFSDIVALVIFRTWSNRYCH